VDVWTVDKQTAQFTGRAVKDSMKVGAPAAATRAVSVAAYTTRNEWEDVLGNPHEAGLTVDDISDFSSEGPRRDGAEKPDVTAPGAMIVSALSDHAPTALDELIDIVNTIMAGTSMASPFVAGLVALLLERNPQLGPESVKELLRGHCTVPGRPLGTFDPKWGYGLLDASGLVVPT
jgi:subtilisin family serine protease